ncbi:hypothetical protein D3C86_2162600 [compost metagenome]
MDAQRVMIKHDVRIPSHQLGDGLRRDRVAGQIECFQIRSKGRDIGQVEGNLVVRKIQTFLFAGQ